MSTLATVLLALAPYTVPPLIALLVYFVKAQIDKLPNNSRDVVLNIVQTAVENAEQVAASQLNSTGKKQLAIESVQTELAHWHLSVPEPVISSMIEAAVLNLNSWSSLKKAASVPVKESIDQKGASA